MPPPPAWPSLARAWPSHRPPAWRVIPPRASPSPPHGRSLPPRASRAPRALSRGSPPRARAPRPPASPWPQPTPSLRLDGGSAPPLLRSQRVLLPSHAPQLPLPPQRRPSRAPPADSAPTPPLPLRLPPSPPPPAPTPPPLPSCARAPLHTASSNRPNGSSLAPWRLDASGGSRGAIASEAPSHGCPPLASAATRPRAGAIEVSARRAERALAAALAVDTTRPAGRSRDGGPRGLPLSRRVQASGARRSSARRTHASTQSGPPDAHDTPQPHARRSRRARGAGDVAGARAGLCGIGASQEPTGRRALRRRRAIGWMPRSGASGARSVRGCAPP